MVSEIKGAGSHPAPTLTNSVGKSGAERQSPTGAPTQKGEVVTVTDLAARLQKLSESVQDLPVVDQKLVNEMREALADGNYKMDELQIADKLTSFENLLGRLERS